MRSLRLSWPSAPFANVGYRGHPLADVFGFVQAQYLGTILSSLFIIEHSNQLSIDGASERQLLTLIGVLLYGLMSLCQSTSNMIDYLISKVLVFYCSSWDFVPSLRFIPGKKVTNV